MTIQKLTALNMREVHKDHIGLIDVFVFMVVLLKKNVSNSGITGPKWHRLVINGLYYDRCLYTGIGSILCKLRPRI